MTRQVKYGDRAFKRVVCWFSCGVASAVATKLAIQEYGKANCVICYQNTGSEHPDNARFLRDCEKWFGLPIQIIKSDKFNNIDEVFEKRRYLSGVKGAPCTSVMKRIPAEAFLNHFDDLEIHGYTEEEKKRLKRWQENNPERFVQPILIEKNLNKDDCLALIEKTGIKLPAMYLLGYRNNNCIGCVKGQAGYWNKIRKDFPEIFERRAKQERKINAAICKTEPTKDGKRTRVRVFLDELPEDAGNHETEPNIICGLMCQLTELETP